MEISSSARASTGWLPTPDERARLGALADALEVNGRSLASLEAMQALLIAHMVEVAQEQYAREARALADGEEGRGWSFRALAEEIAGVLGCARATAEARMADAVALVNRYPRVLASMQEGRVSAGQARVIVELGDELESATARARFEELVLGVLAEHALTPGRLRPVAEAVAERLQPRSLRERHEEEAGRRRVVFQRGRHGMGWVRMYVSALVGEGIVDRSRQLAEELAAADVDGSDERTAEQRQVDVLCDLALAGAPTAGPQGVPTGLAGIRASVQITIPARAFIAAAEHRAAGAAEIGGGGDDELADPCPDGDTADATAQGSGRDAFGRPTERLVGGAAVLCGHGAIPIVQAVELAVTAPVWERLFVDADTGALLTVDLRFPNAAQRRYLRARDEHCRFPGCRRPIRKRLSDADHTIDHCLGGPTCVCNLAYLCEYHHTLKHHSAWTVVQRPGGVLEWTSPTGRTCTDVPPPVVRFIHDGDPPPF
ncbi:MULTISPECIES: HNH endonuclease signature motif containing protein [unclassified Microbacterium]|uniref:HNH endonuclease signature motif containing protein n=1 Tax=Microbacterium TaxID=33882 RepID=UPI003BA1EA81